MRKVVLITMGLIVFLNCTIILKQSIEVDTIESTFVWSFFYTIDGEKYRVFFTGPDSTSCPNTLSWKSKFRRDTTYTLYINLGVDKSRLDNFSVKPEISTIYEDGEEFLIYKYGAGRAPHDYINVFIKDEKVVKMKGRLFLG